LDLYREEDSRFGKNKECWFGEEKLAIIMLKKISANGGEKLATIIMRIIKMMKTRSVNDAMPVARLDMEGTVDGASRV